MLFKEPSLSYSTFVRSGVVILACVLSLVFLVTLISVVGPVTFLCSIAVSYAKTLAAVAVLSESLRQMTMLTWLAGEIVSNTLS